MDLRWRKQCSIEQQVSTAPSQLWTQAVVNTKAITIPVITNN